MTDWNAMPWCDQLAHETAYLKTIKVGDRIMRGMMINMRARLFIRDTKDNDHAT
jgi:hypothetical protein